MAAARRAWRMLVHVVVVVVVTVAGGRTCGSGICSSAE